MFEMIAVVLLILYGIKSCLSKTKTRSSYGFFAMLFYFISVLPVFFIGTQMKSVHHALFLTIFFGALSFFCWGRTIVKTNAKDDGSFEFIPVKELIEVDVAVDSSKKTVINRSQGTTDPLRDLEETNDISKFSIDDDNSQHSDDKKD